MITVTEVRNMNKYGQVEHRPKELAPKDALKQLVLNELGHGAIITEATPTILMTSTENPDGTVDHVIFEGPEKEMELLVLHSKFYRVSWHQNEQYFSSLFSLWDQIKEKERAESVTSVKNPEIQKSMPIFIGFCAPALLGQENSNDIHVLLGQGKRTSAGPGISYTDFEKALKEIEKDLKAGLHTVTMTIAPIADA